MAEVKIRGRVADDTSSKPLKGVNVQMLAKRVKTDSKGKYVLTIDLDETTSYRFKLLTSGI